MNISKLFFCDLSFFVNAKKASLGFKCYKCDPNVENLNATSGSTLYNVFVRLITKQSGTQVPSIDISQDETIGDNIS